MTPRSPNAPILRRRMAARPVIVAALLWGVLSSASGFSLDSRGAHPYFQRNERLHSKVPFLDGNVPLHEQLADKALECGRPNSLCERLGHIGITQAHLHEGLRSNDFPATYFTEDTFLTCINRLLRITTDSDVVCILASYGNAASNKHRFKDPRWTKRRSLGVRGHFGDLQFLHAMAPEGQPAHETYQHIRMWMEFAYRASREEFKLKSDASAVPVKGMNSFFVRGARKVGDLLDYRFSYPHASAVALGQMLHLAQDSFAHCHATRDANGQVTQFLSYLHQDKTAHGVHDKDLKRIDALERLPLNPVAFARDLLEMRATNQPWETVEPLIQRYFEPTPNAEPAGRGKDC